MPSHDKRITPRLPVRAGNYASYQAGAGNIRDLSQSGVFIEDKSPVSEGTTFDFNLHLGKETLACRGVVRRHIPGQGMGVQFVEISRDARMRLERYLNTVAKSPG